jgi:MFS family permease
VLAALAAWLALMGLAGVEDVGAYLAVAALIGVANAFEMPIRQTLLREIVEDRALVTSAIGVSGMVFNVGRMVGPAVAGVLLAFISEAWCFAINALSFVAIIGALLAMRLPPAPVSAPAPGPRGSGPTSVSSCRSRPCATCCPPSPPSACSQRPTCR